MRQVPKLKLFTVVICSEFGNNMLIPLLSFIFFATDSPLFPHSTDMAQRSLLFGLCLSLYKLAGVIGCMLITALSDHFGRKLALNCALSGLLIVAACGAIALYIHSPILFITGYIIVGFLDTILATGPAIAGDISENHNRISNMANMQCFISLGACLGPIIGGQLANQHGISTAYALPFFVAAIIAGINLWLIQTSPETLNQAVKEKISLRTLIRDYLKLLRNPHLAWLFLLFILCQFSWSSYYEFIPPTLKNIFHFSPSAVGLFVGLIAFWLIIATGIMMRPLLKFFSYQQLLWISACAVACGTLMSLLASAYPSISIAVALLWLSPVFTAMGDVVFFSLFAGFLAQSVAAHQLGKVMGLTRTIAYLVWSFTAMLGGLLLTWRHNGALAFAPLGAIILLGIFSFNSRAFQFLKKEESYDFMS